MLVIHSTFREPSEMLVAQEEKTLASASMRNVRSRTTGTLPTRSHTLRSCRIVEPSYKQSSSQGRRNHSRASLNLNTSQSSSTITCANISLQRKVHKKILVAESDSNSMIIARYFHPNPFDSSCRLWGISRLTHCTTR